MIKNILIYLGVLTAVFVFSIFYYEWFSWFLLLMTICIPFISLIISLPFMITTALNGVIVFSNSNIKVNDDILIGVAGKKGNNVFCPMMRIIVKAENRFAKTKSKIKIKYGGVLNTPIYTKATKMNKDCGCIEFKAKYCKVYDFMGIFFIPVRIKNNFECFVMPEEKETETLPECEKIPILGYKPKSGGGFSDFYELREYQNGDSLKNIHWKLSTKLDKLIVREPSIPVYKDFVVKTSLTASASDNNIILRKLAFVCRYLNKKGTVCNIAVEGLNTVNSVSNNTEFNAYLKALYKGIKPANPITDIKDSIVFSILPDREEVVQR